MEKGKNAMFKKRLDGTYQQNENHEFNGCRCGLVPPGAYHICNCMKEDSPLYKEEEKRCEYCDNDKDLELDISTGCSQGVYICKDVYACRYRMLDSIDYYRRRVDLLAKHQKQMRDPERTIVCDILANAALLPDPKGLRYGKKE